MVDQTQPQKQPDAQDSQAQGGDYGNYDDGRPKADPMLTKRFEALEKALHGAATTRRRGPLNWSGDDQTTAVFDSIAQALLDAIPEPRPTTDLQPKSGNPQSGG